MSLKYPSGHIKYSFNMYVDYGKSIICNIDDSRIQKINIDKSFPDDPFDPKWQLVIIFFEVSSIEEVDSIGGEIKDDIFNLLSFKLKVEISDIRQTGHGVTPREGEGGQCYAILPAFTSYGEAKSGGRKLYQTEVDEIEQDLFKSKKLKKNTLVSIFSYAMRIKEPVVQFMLLYLILYEIYKDQKSIDEFIMKVAPNTVQIPSPHNSKLETIYTKLRNEITHRIGISPEETRNGIIGNMIGLKEISHVAIVSGKE
jgi:hypothetical protein